MGDAYHLVYCTTTGCTTHNGTPELHSGTTCPCGYASGTSVYGARLVLSHTDTLGIGETYTAGSTLQFNVAARLVDMTGADISTSSMYTITYTWTNAVPFTVNSNQAYLATNANDTTTYTVTCQVTATPVTGLATPLTQTVTWVATPSTGVAASATVYNNGTGYQLGQLDAAGKTSVADQIAACVAGLNSNYVLSYVQFDTPATLTQGALSATAGKNYYYTGYNYGYGYGNGYGYGSGYGNGGGYVYDPTTGHTLLYVSMGDAYHLVYCTATGCTVHNGTPQLHTGVSCPCGYAYGSGTTIPGIGTTIPGIGTDSLNNVVYYPASGYVGTATFGFTAYYYDRTTGSATTNLQPVRGVVAFDVQAGNQTTDISMYITALYGQSVKLEKKDFEEFWEDQYPRGTLTSVQFTGVTPGYLYNNYKSNTYSSALPGGTICYAQPNAYQVGLDDLTYVHGNNLNAATIRFSATGTTKRNGDATDTVAGSICIVYTKDAVPVIEYEPSAKGGTLDADDFTALYKSVMGVSTIIPASLSIQFLNLPAYGSLYADYSGYTGRDILLKESNLDDYTFSANSAAVNSIDDVTFIPGTTKVADSVDYACYYGGSLKFIGTIKFGSAEPVVVEKVSTGGAVALKISDFTSLDALSGLTGSAAIRFGTPSSGTLYKSYSNGTGTRVSNSETFSLTSSAGTNSLNNVTFVPYVNYVGAVEIPFYVATVLGGQVQGTLKIYVSQNFTDISGASWAWASPSIARLSSLGVVNGKITTPTLQFCPGQAMTYGESLKLIMRAAGYPEQVKTGDHWASGYLSRAYRDGLVASATANLDAPVDRETIANIVGKALKLTAASYVDSGVTAPTDTTNGYVYALYNAGVLKGEFVNNVNYYKPAASITRAEVCVIVCRVMDYVG